VLAIPFLVKEYDANTAFPNPTAPALFDLF